MSDPVNGLFERMVEDATEKVAKKGWEKATQKEITLAAFGMINRQIKSKMTGVTRPFWWMASIIAAGVLWYIISGALGLG